jgi:predicted  nucleic acid-binding Zn-ribbon protein
MKHTCQHCGALFYDMRKSPPTCPKCGAEQEVEKPRSRRAAAAAAEPVRPVPVAAAKVVPEEAEAEIELEGDEVAAADEEDEEFIEDAGDLGEDEDDVAGVIDGVVEGDEKE